MTAQHVGRTWNKGKLLGAKSPLRTCLGDPKPQLEGQATLPCSILPSTAILKGPSKKPDPASLLTEQTREAGCCTLGQKPSPRSITKFMPEQTSYL
jgi:hypothetical protein